MKIDCAICAGTARDGELERLEVWRDAHWRLTVSISSEVAGFAYLEPLRHIPYITDLDGAEAASFGPTIARCTRILREVTGADVVYAYIFGDGIPHLHVHLAPHRAGDALNDQMIRGELIEEKLPSGMTRFTSAAFPPLPRAQLEEIAERVRRGMSSD